VRSFHEHPLFISWLSEALRRTLGTLDDRARAHPTVLFTAHSLPVRTLTDGTQRCKTCDCDDSCRYRDGLQSTADLVAATVGLEDHRIAWQSVGRTADPWWGPGIDEVIPQLVAEGRTAVVVCCAGFVADHLETLYDLDIEASTEAAEAGLAFARTPMPNADPAFCDMLAAVVREHLAGVPV
jgi:ferrochelatase